MEKDICIRGVVLREENLGENDKIVTLLTAEKGRITVSCKGARSLKSKRFYAVQLFTYSDIVIGEKSGRYYFKEASVIESFVGIRDSLEKISLASYIAEAAACVTVEEQDESETLSLVLNSLYVLSRDEKPLLLVKAVFEARLAYLLGFEPILDACSDCGRFDGEFYIDLVGGVLRCSDCVFGNDTPEVSEGSLLFVKESELAAFRYIMKCPAKRIFSFNTELVSLDSLSALCEKYLLAHIERDFSTLDFLRKLISQSSLI